MTPCTVTVLTLNSGRTLERCLESVKDAAEILILDGNSTDNTCEIARRFGARIEKQYDTDEPNVRAKDFSELRRKSYGLATHPWVFYVDSDEWVSPELWEEIARAVAENNPAKAYAFSRVAVIDGRPRTHAFFYPDWCVRLWHKESGVQFKMRKMVHEQIEVPPSCAVVHLPGALYAEWPPLPAYKKKHEFYLSLVRAKSEASRDNVNRFRELRAAFKNAVRACGMAIKIFANLIRHPSSDRVPFLYQWMFVTYHLQIALIRVRNIFA